MAPFSHMHESAAAANEYPVTISIFHQKKAEARWTFLNTILAAVDIAAKSSLLVQRSRSILQKKIGL